jgi:hypothetical protein
MLGFISEGIRFNSGKPFRSGPILLQELAQVLPRRFAKLFELPDRNDNRHRLATTLDDELVMFE